MRSSLFGDVTQLLLVVSYRRFVITYLSHLQRSSSPLKMGPTGCSKTLLINYHTKFHNIPEERRHHLHCDQSLKSRAFQKFSRKFAYLLFHDSALQIGTVLLSTASNNMENERKLKMGFVSNACRKAKSAPLPANEEDANYGVQIMCT